MKKAGFALVLIVIFLSSLTSVLADGGFIILDKDIWFMFDEEQQYCAINYNDGIQHMILTVDTTEELRGDAGVWIFPVPADPEETDINILKGFPMLYGRDLKKEAEDSVHGAFLLMSATQIYPFPFFFMFYGVMSGSFMAGSRLLASQEAAGVTVDDARVKALVASLEGVNIDEAIEKASVAVAAPAPAAAAPAGGDAPAEKKAEKNPEEEKKKDEQAAAGLGALFG